MLKLCTPHKNALHLFSPVIFLFLFNAGLKAGEDSLRLVNNLRLGVKVQHGWIVPHHSSIRYVTHESLNGAEVSLTTDSYGRSNWDALYRYPRLGIGYLYTDLGNDEIHGVANAAFMTLDIPFTSFTKRFTPSYQFCLGLAYINRVFNPTENPLNYAISTPLNVYASLRFNASYRFYKHSEVYLGLCLSHYSNGRIATPNRGLNTVAWQFGLRTDLLPERYERIVPDELPPKKYHTLMLTLSGGIKTDDQLSGKHYPVTTLVGDYAYRFSRKYGVLAGFDLFYDASIGPNKEAMLEVEAQRSDLYQMGLHAGLCARFSGLELYGHIGHYLYASYTKYTRTYLRLGIRYSWGTPWMVNLSIKSHRAIADYVEWGIGYRLAFKPGRKK